MSAPDAPQFDEARIVQVLDRHCVAYVLVGGLGALLHGASRPTLDFDLCAAWDLDNLGRLVDALRELGAELRVRPGVHGYVGLESSGPLLPCSPMRPSFTSQDAGRWGSRPAGPEVGQEGSIRRSAPGIGRLASAFPARRG